MKRRSLLVVIGPGILVAATGVGAGDLATASFTGAQLGMAVLWAVLVGAFIKYVLNEGLARWQLVTGQTLLEGCMTHLGWPFRILFLLYLLLWSFFVGSALMAACGVTLHALMPVFEEPATGKFWFGILHSAVGVALVLAGGYKVFERIMGVCIAFMFVTVVATAMLLSPDWGAVLSGIAIPRIPQFDEEGLSWIIALMGGVGGTLTVLCYGYWIREEGREGAERIGVTRLDLATGYSMTAIFGIAMVIIGSQTTVEGKGAGLVVALAANLEDALGPAGKWLFLAGAWGAVFSSLLGVWQSVPYIFADFVGMLSNGAGGEGRDRVSTSSTAYRVYLLLLAVIPILGLRYGFRDLQKYYALVGAGFMPFLAAVLLYLNGRRKWMGDEYRNRLWTNGMLLAIMLFFAIAGWLTIRNKFGW